MSEQTCPTCKSGVRAYRVGVGRIVDGRAVWVASCSDEWHNRMPMPPVAPPAPQEPSEPAKHCAWTFCPKCGAKESNDGSRGGTENCWHCVCGFIACVYDYPTEDLRAENTRLREALDKSDAEVELLEAYVEDLRNICQRANIDPDAARAALTPQGQSTDGETR